MLSLKVISLAEAKQVAAAALAQAEGWAAVSPSSSRAATPSTWSGPRARSSRRWRRLRKGPGPLLSTSGQARRSRPGCLGRRRRRPVGAHPRGAATRHIINAERLALMKPTAILVNTSRGSTVDEAALAEARAAERIAAAGLDVFERGPCSPPALVALDNAILLPHIGSATIEARTAMGMQAADNLDAFFAGQAPPDRVA